jgi:hypothetical protein
MDETVGPSGPEGGLLTQPPLRVPKRIGLDRHPVLSAPDLAPDEACRFENADVAGDASKGHGEGPGKIRDAGVALSQSH